MKIAELTILKNISTADLEAILNDPNREILVGFSDSSDKTVELDVAPLFRTQDPWSETLRKTFDFADYHLNKDDIMFIVLPNGNQFELKASRLIDENDNTEAVNTHEVVLLVTTNTGNIRGKVLDQKEFVIDIAEDIPQTVKDEFSTVGLTLTGEKWNLFTIEGKAQIQFKKISEDTVLVGNNENGFLTV